MTFTEVVRKISDERDQQEAKWAPHEHTPRQWAMLVVEEMGEVARAVMEGGGDDQLKKELIQTAAVLVAWLETMEVKDGVTS